MLDRLKSILQAAWLIYLIIGVIYWFFLMPAGDTDQEVLDHAAGRGVGRNGLAVVLLWPHYVAQDF